jgi:Trk K+ transport system NAD-binding subunit
MRVMRALWRDTLALWREFRRPFLAFVAVVFGGGWLYGELYAFAGHGHIPYVQLPYLMVQLMILQTPGDPPTELYLITFWYMLPLIAIYIIGSGAVDFVRLFFDRSGRRSAWEEAVASTYRNHVIVLGVGHVGLRVIRSLVEMGFDVVAIDSKAKPDLEEDLAKLGVPLIVGDGRLPTTLEKAGLRVANAFVVCTASDSVNLEAILRARDLNPDIRMVARMWDNQFANPLKERMGVQVLSASDLAAPAFAGSAVGIQITQTVHINKVAYSMITLEVAPGSFLDGGTIGDLQAANQMDIVLHGRGDAVVVQPEHAQEVQAGDMLTIFARHDHVIKIVERNRNGVNARR